MLFVPCTRASAQLCSRRMARFALGLMFVTITTGSSPFPGLPNFETGGPVPKQREARTDDDFLMRPASPISVESKFEEGLRIYQPFTANARSVEAKAVFESPLLDNHPDALFLLGEIAMFGDLSTENAVDMAVDPTTAFNYYSRAADMGHPMAQYKLAVSYASGIGAPKGARDEALAVLYFYFASLSGNVHASLALGYRHHFGRGVPKSCRSASQYYKAAAEEAVYGRRATGMSSLVEKNRLGDLEDSGSGSVREDDVDVVQYYQYSAKKGDVQAQLALGQLYFYGARGVVRDYTTASDYLEQAAEQDDAQAMTHLAHLYLFGQGVAQNNDTALHWYTKASQEELPAALNGLGYMHLYGYGDAVGQDSLRAIELFKQAADAGNSEGQFNLGVLHLAGKGGLSKDFSQALSYFTKASQQGHTLAMYNLALMHLEGVGVQRSCSLAVQLLKTVAERGPISEYLKWAYRFKNNGAFRTSMLIYSEASECGMEVAQSNAAWLYSKKIKSVGSAPGGGSGDGADGAAAVGSDEGGGGDDSSVQALGSQAVVVSGGGLRVSDDVRHQRALHLYGSSAEQGSKEAQVKVGDCHYYGLGTNVSFAKAARHYRAASDVQHPRAMFNLAYMHQDVHLARRYFDMSKQSSGAAYAPVQLALVGVWLQTQLPKCTEFVIDIATQLQNADSDSLTILALFGFLLLALLFRQL